VSPFFIPGLEAEPPVKGSQAEPGNQLMHEPKRGKLHQSQQPSLSDAYRDAVNETSTRPMVSLVTKSENLALGRDLDDILTNPSLKNFRIIGDVDLFQEILGRETNDQNNPDQLIVWRLLIENDKWAYIYPALSKVSKKNGRPLTLAISSGEGSVQMMILSRPKIEE
jgi:hypothetical protein